MLHLNKATEFFTEKLTMLTAMEKETELLNQKAKDMEAKQDQIKRSLNRHYERKEQHERHMNEESARLKRLELHWRKEVAETERKRELNDKQAEALRNENRELHSQVLKAKIESAQMIAQREGDSQLQIQNMRRIVEEQQRLKAEADNEARSARHKSNFLADRNKSLSNKLSDARARIKELEARAARAPSKSPGPGRDREAKKEETEEETEDENELDVRALEDDGFLEVDYKAASSPPAKRQRTMERDLFHKGKTKRDDTPIIVLDDQDDLDAEADEKLYRMAGPSSRPPLQAIFSSSNLRSSRRGSDQTTPSGLMLPVGIGEGSGPSPRTSPGSRVSEAMDPFNPHPEPHIPSSDDDFGPSPAQPPRPATRTSPRWLSSSTSGGGLNTSSTRELAQRALEGTAALGPRRRNR